MPQRHYKFGDPITLNLKITNTTDYPFAVGSNGAIKVGMAIAGTLRGLASQDMGPFAFDNAPHVFRLERHASLVQQIRVDCGLLRDALLSNPVQMMDVDLMILNEPRVSPNNISAGLGGQMLRGASFEREGFANGSVEGLNKLVTDLPTLPLEQRVLDSGALAVLMTRIKDEAAPDITSDSSGSDISGVKTMAELKQSMVDALIAEVKNSDLLEQAWLLRMTPLRDVPQPFADAQEKACVASKEPLVRVLWYRRNVGITGLLPEHKDDTLTLLHKAAANDADPLAKEYAAALVEELALPPATSIPSAIGPTAPRDGCHHRSPADDGTGTAHQLTGETRDDSS